MEFIRLYNNRMEAGARCEKDILLNNISKIDTTCKVHVHVDTLKYELDRCRILDSMINISLVTTGCIFRL